MRTRILSFVLVLVFLFSLSAFAAPASISSGDYGSAGYITITNPNKDYSTTYNKTVTISGYAKAGARVYVYLFNGSEYRPYYQNGSALSTSVGASGIFAIPVNLSAGRNRFLLRAEYGGKYQNATFEVNVLSSSMFNMIGRLQSLTSGWK